jgi:hypothetical protein
MELDQKPGESFALQGVKSAMRLELRQIFPVKGLGEHRKSFNS